MRRDLFLALTSGLAFTLAFPPFRLGFLAYWALVPLFFLLDDKQPGDAFRWGYLAGLFISFGTIYWIGWVTVPGALATLAIHPLYFGLYGLLHVFLRRRLGQAYIFAIPFLWTGIEYLKSLGELGFPWVSLGYTQSYYLSLIQFSTYTSVFGVSFWVATINALVYAIVLNLQNIRRSLVLLAILILLFLVPWIYGRQVIPKANEFQETIRVAVVQGNIDPYMKWAKENQHLSFDVYGDLTREAASSRPDLIVWPETATPAYLRIDRKHLDWIFALVDSLGVPLVTGTPDVKFFGNGAYRTYNSVFLLIPNQRSIQSYAKVHLVPFGERVPYEDRLPFIKALLDRLEMGEGNFSPGKKIVVLGMPWQGGELGLGPVICFESIFPDLVRRFIARGAGLLLVVTNDAWFGKEWVATSLANRRPKWLFGTLARWLSSGMYQHARIAVFRAIENRISIARAANTGVSEMIDPYGRVRKRLGIWRRGVLVDDLPPRGEETFYSRHGDLFAKTVLGVNLIPLTLAWLGPWRVARSRKRAGSEPKPVVMS